MHPDLSKNDNSADIHYTSAAISSPLAVEGERMGSDIKKWPDISVWLI